MSDLDTLLQRNHRFRADYEGGMTSAPLLNTIVLTCADARVDPAHFLGLGLGEALIFRNAGARVTDTVELDLGLLWTLVSRAAGDSFAGLSLLIIHHSDCGFEKLADPGVAAAVSAEVGLAVEHLQGLVSAGPAQRLRDDIERLRSSPRVPNGLVVSGCLYCVETGVLEEIVAPAPLG